MFNVAEGKGFGSCGVFDQAPYKEAGLSYHGMVIRDNVDAKDGGKQQALFSEAADVIETILAKVTFWNNYSIDCQSNMIISGGN